MRKTEKLYYQDPYRVSTTATVVKIDEEGVELDSTVAYPEGGGQEADTGLIEHPASGTIVAFADVRRRFGADVRIEGDKYINVDGVISHIVTEVDRQLLGGFSIGDQVIVRIDPLRREKLSTSHSACHLLYLAVMEVRPGIEQNLIGCHVREGQARFDMLTDERFDEEEISRIGEIANRYVDGNHPISLYASDSHPDARFWACAGQVVPCGGTHIERTGQIGRLTIKRKNIGKGKERLICVLPELEYSVARYR
ncbi:synthetase [Marinobacterium zhoushanense]|uniref:Synthetase n=1 Tax=Marinobacterium zhoushanense TaxID=1679163 RepID=A0ABQ1KC66_9GAMM|nr:alanyl-tRNA editing protein [Marinobacterium zhoushanense]GGB91258.1 synthetase [Marinobacterium zhoushanense]